MIIDKERARMMLREVASLSDRRALDQNWEAKVEKLSRLCEEGVSKTHIAFLGTAMLAKATEPKADLFAIKPSHEEQNPRAYSARSLCHGVLVPLAAELGISLGVTGREPLNNQPYFRMTRLDDGTPVHAGGRAAFEYMLDLVRELQEFTAAPAAVAALRAFVAVRRRYQPRYSEYQDGGLLTPKRLNEAIDEFVLAGSEGGRRAQAVAAGLLDVFAGVGRVESGRINDPSRKYPGDVCIRDGTDPSQWEKAFEVRDKPVSAVDVQIFGKKCIDMGIREAAVVMVSRQQRPLDREALAAWAAEYGIGLTIFHGWSNFIEQALFWSTLPIPAGVGRAVEFIHHRLIAVEASSEAVALWRALTKA